MLLIQTITYLFMSTQSYKRILLNTSYFILLVFSLFFSAAVYAEANITVADLNSAYNYYSNTSGNSSANERNMPAPTRTYTRTSNTGEGLGDLAGNLMEPVSIVSGFLSGMSIIIGLTCLFGSFVRYMQYRVNPLANPIGTVITLLVLGLLLLLLPLIYKLTESGVPFSLG